MLPHRHWWNKANTPYIEYDVYFSFKISFVFFTNLFKKVDELMIEDTDLAPFNINSTLKRHDMDR